MDYIERIDKEKGIKLTHQQEQVIKHVDGPALSLAVPGAGKTTALVLRTGNLVYNLGIAAENILSMTFSKAAALDMLYRYNSLFEKEIKSTGIRVKFSTIHSFAYGVVKKYYKFSRLIEGGNEEINKASILRGLYREYAKAYLGDEDYEEYVLGISLIANKMKKIDDISDQDLKEICSQPHFREIYTDYNKYKRKHRYIDFDDMLVICNHILKNNKHILDHYNKIYQYIQLDEAQDTSTLQFSISHMLAGPKKNILYLCDDDQCIYESFRAADYKYLLNFRENYKDGTIYYMEENFRSNKNIVEVANKLIKKNKGRYEKNMITERDKGRPIHIVQVDDDKAQLEYILEKIGGSKNYRENAILYRNNISAITVYDILNKNKIPIKIRERRQYFFSKWVIKDLLNFMLFALDESNYEVFKEIYYKSFLYISKHMVEKTSKFHGEENLLDFLIKSPDTDINLKERLGSFKRKLKTLRNKSGSQISSFILKDLQYEDYLKEACKSQGANLDLMKSYISILKLLTADCQTIEEVVDNIKRLEIQMQSSQGRKDENAVTLSSIHSAKGLEFDNVYMIDMVDSMFPANKAISQAEKEGEFSLIEEERRLCYVAITRGRKKVDLIVPHYKNEGIAGRSRFIDELEAIGDISFKDLRKDIGKKKTPIGERKVALEELPPLEEGDMIDHKHFGKGKVVNYKKEEDRVIIDFKIGSKNLSYKTCIENNIIKKIG